MSDSYLDMQAVEEAIERVETAVQEAAQSINHSIKENSLASSLQPLFWGVVMPVEGYLQAPVLPLQEKRVEKKGVYLSRARPPARPPTPHSPSHSRRGPSPGYSLSRPISQIGCEYKVIFHY